MAIVGDTSMSHASPLHGPQKGISPAASTALEEIRAFEPDERINLSAESLLKRESAVEVLRPLNNDTEVAKALVEIMCDKGQPDTVRHSARAALQGSTLDFVTERIQLEMDFEMIQRPHYESFGRGGFRKSEWYDAIEEAVTKIQTRNSEPEVAARLRSMLQRDSLTVARCLQGTRDPDVLKFAKDELKAAVNGTFDWIQLTEVVPIILVNSPDEEARELLVAAITSDKLPPFRYQSYVARAASRELGEAGVEAMRRGLVDVNLHRSDSNFLFHLSLALKEDIVNDLETQKFLVPLVSGDAKSAARYLVKLETQRKGRKAGKAFARQLSRMGTESLMGIRVAAARVLFDVSENARTFVEKLRTQPRTSKVWQIADDLRSGSGTG